MTIELVVDTDGARPVVVKRATAPEEAGRLRAEAARIRAAGHPGVVALLDERDLPGGGVELRLAHGGRPLSLVGRLAPERAAAVATAVAATLADLHGAGWVHGRLTADHVLLGSRGRPVLAGVGPGVEGAAPADDVAALGELIVGMLEGGDDAVAIPDRRLPWRRPGSGATWMRRALLTLADQAAADDPAHRPPARRLAASLADAVPGAALPTAEDQGVEHHQVHADGDEDVDVRHGSAPPPPAPPPPAPPRPPRAAPSFGVLARMGLGLVGLVLVGAGIARLTGPGPRPTLDAPAGAAGDPMAPATTVTAPAATAPDAAGDASDAPVAPGGGPRCPAGQVGPDVDGDGCPDPVRIEGNVVSVGDARYEVGEPGDRLVVGDWDCDGRATVALLRPSSGEVFVFHGWAGDEDLAVRPADTVPGAVDLLVDDLGAGCHGLAAVGDDGSRTDVDGVAA